MAQPNSLSGVLAGIPGLRGWQAQDQFRQEQMQGDQTNQLNQMKLADMYNARQQQMQDEQQLKSVMSQTGGDPAKAVQALLTAGTPKSIELASKLHGLIQNPTPEKTPDYAQLLQIRDAYHKAGDQENVLLIDKQLEKLNNINASQGNVNPYFTPVSTDTGLGSFDNRTGKIAPLTNGGVPIIKAADSPKVRGAVAEAVKLGTDTGEQKALLPNQKNALTSVDNAITLMDKGIYTGAYANFKKSGAKYTPFVDTKKAANTETFLSEIGNTIVPRLKEFGGNDSNEELKYLRQISGGEITLEEPAMKAILASTKMKIERGITRLSQGMDVNGNPANSQQVQQTHNTLPNPKDYAGKIARDTVSGKRYQSNGTTWMLVK